MLNLKVLVIADIHANIDALNSVLKIAGGFDDVLVLGDLVDYGPDPAEVIDAVRGLGASVVMGNHDNAVAFGVDCRCSERIHWLSVWFRENVTFKLVSRNDREFLTRLPTKLELELGNLKVLVVHASPSNPLYGYLYPWSGKDELCKSLTHSFRLSSNYECDLSYDLYLVGHTHHQFLLTMGRSRVLNPGSVGQPRDGVPRASYAIVDVDRGNIILGRVKYDVDAVIRRLEALGVGGDYLRTLKYILHRAQLP